MTIIWSIVGFVLVMGVLVTIHEWGHYIVAKFFNIKVLTFSVGFGKPIFKKQWGETQYQLSMIPLGGYVKFLDERNEETICAGDDLTRAFNRQSVFKRFAVVVAGPVVNLLFAWLVFSWLYFSGVPGIKPLFDSVIPNSSLAESLPVADQQIWQVVQIEHSTTQTWQMVHQQLLLAKLAGKSSVTVGVRPFSQQQANIRQFNLSLSGMDINNARQDWFKALGFGIFQPRLSPIIGKVLKQSAAEKAGFQVGDRILSIAGQPISSWSLFAEQVRIHPGQTIKIAYERNGRRQQALVKLGEVHKAGEVIGVFGAALKVDKTELAPYQTLVRYPFIESINQGLNHSVNLISMSLDMIQKMFQQEVSPTNLSGPISIADYSGKALEMGWGRFFALLGLLSLSLGILNLLPIPLLDGGHLMMYLIEIFKGVPVNESVELVAQKLGLMIIVGLTLFAFINDLVRISND